MQHNLEKRQRKPGERLAGEGRRGEGDSKGREEGLRNFPVLLADGENWSWRATWGRRWQPQLEGQFGTSHISGP